MNIGIFTDCYYPQINGVVTSVMTLREELIRRGHNVTIVTVQVPGYKKSSDGVIRIKAIPKFKLMDFRMALPLFYQDYQCIRDLQLDVIHTHTEFTIGLFGQFVASRLKIPMLHTYHTMYEDYTNYILRIKRGRGLVKRFMRHSSKRYVRRYDAVVVPSLKTEKALRSYGIKNSIHILPTGIDLAKFPSYEKVDPHLAALRQRLGLADSTKVVLSLGRVSEEKSVDVIIAQMEALSARTGDVRLLVVGDGPYMAPLQRLARDKGLERHVQFVGRVPWEEVPYYYSLADVFVSASKTETQGLTILEAMACQVPVVVYEDDNVADLIRDGVSGRLFKTSEELTKCLESVLLDPEYAESLAVRGRQVAASLSTEKFGEMAEKLYLGLLEKTIEIEGDTDSSAVFP
ncbi:glycosyltransferase family 4 protein [Acidaminobacter sp.]|uniref:glycosyltransferase family 4 protein n=1 Tax=Acidaminobacter sp. TaxID=1872102 RepID=UPI001383381D|nr:glycosyltransferase family 4 protein [Acidaminobacter sp.]MDK9711360.1 glycosyltransferase family 4 protein [Acidaminobacter sp.]MZQ96587.1 glycosyltransferase [Acidaminobacter sp.]